MEECHHSGKERSGTNVASGILPDVEDGILPPGTGRIVGIMRVVLSLTRQRCASVGLEAPLHGRQDA